MNRFCKYTFVVTTYFILNSCATYKTQYKDEKNQKNFPDKEIEHSFYLIGDAGNSPLGQSTIAGSSATDLL